MNLKDSNNDSAAMAINFINQLPEKEKEKVFDELKKERFLSALKAIRKKNKESEYFFR